jgi:hypothetical protein
VNIAEAAVRYLQHPPVKELIDIPRMALIAQEMLRDALDAYVRRDVALAQRVLSRDDELDLLKSLVFRELLGYMLKDQSHHQGVDRSHPDLAPPRAHRRPRHEPGRRRHLYGVGAGRTTPNLGALLSRAIGRGHRAEGTQKSKVKGPVADSGLFEFFLLTSLCPLPFALCPC